MQVVCVGTPGHVIAGEVGPHLLGMGPQVETEAAARLALGLQSGGQAGLVLLCSGAQLGLQQHKHGLVEHEHMVDRGRAQPAPPRPGRLSHGRVTSAGSTTTETGMLSCLH